MESSFLRLTDLNKRPILVNVSDIRLIRRESTEKDISDYLNVVVNHPSTTADVSQVAVTTQIVFKDNTSIFVENSFEEIQQRLYLISL